MKTKKVLIIFISVICVLVILTIAAIVYINLTAPKFEYDYESELTLMDDFTITAHSGAYDTEDNSIEYIQTAIQKDARIVEFDVRQRPDGTLVMSHDSVKENDEGTPLTAVFELLKDTDIRMNLDIKDTKPLKNLYPLLEEYDLADRAFLTGINLTFVPSLKKSDCAKLDYYLNCKPSEKLINKKVFQNLIIKLLEKTGAVGVNCEHIYANEMLSSLLHDNGYKLSVWTVNDEETGKRMLAVSPDNITSRNPDVILKILKKE